MQDAALAPHRSQHIEDSYPLTPTQQGMIFHRLLDRESGVDVQQLVLTLEDAADERLLRRRFEELVDRHAVLRTTFRWEGVDEPVQEVWSSAALPWVEVDGAGPDDTWLREDRRRGFELTEPPLMRVALFRGADRLTLVWTYHQALLDGSSLSLVLDELLGGEAPAGAPPFRDHVEWLRANERADAEPVWREVLRGFTAPTPLPPSRPAGQRGERGEIDVAIGASGDALQRELARRGLPMESLITSIAAVLLQRYSGETDIVVGVAQSRRAPLPGAARMPGFFINTIPARVLVRPEQNVWAWFRAVHEERERLRAWEQTPLVNIQKWSSVPAGTPLFETLLIFEPMDPSALRPNGVVREARLLDRTSYPLAITVYERPQPALRISFDRSRIDDAAVHRMAGHLTMALEQLASGFDGSVAALPILTPAERHQVLIEWNETTFEYPRHRGVHELIAERARVTPDRIALRFEGEALTYAELDRRANRIATRLRALGVRAETLVGILMERSPDLVAALLGIWKAGGAYVPLDPMYPVDRLEYMLEDSRAPVLVTQSSLATLLSARDVSVLSLDRGWHESAEESGDGLTSISGGENLAYVIYTSGSTGKPKGVQIPHRALVNFLYTMREAPGLTETDTLLAVTTLSFDIAGLELWLPLLVGAGIELVSREIASDGRRLAEVLDASRATVMQATPATWRMLLETGWKGDPRLKILCGGEAMPGDLAGSLLARCGALWNVYGPTETTIWSTAHHVREAEGTTAPIGRPIGNTTIYLLDTSLEPVPIGAAGELHIGGEGVARGYLNRPELTAQRFIADPFSRVPGARLYKTGDAARYLPDGRIEYLNRLDNQVKLRGYRIELGEIEAALRRHADVGEAVVVLRTDVPGGKALAAYIVSATRQPAAAELRQFLKESLPEYMVPSYFVAMDELPLTPNGKIDRRALPAPDASARETQESFVAPRDALEAGLAKLWSEILGVPKVGVTDNFFELGGESLLALRLFLRIEQTFGRKLPLATLIQASTVEALANALRGDGWSAPWSPLVPIQTSGTRTPFFCIHGVGGNVINYRALSQHLGNDQPFYALQARGLDGSQQPLTDIVEMARLYLEEVRRIQPHGPYLLGGLSFGGVVAFEMAQQLRDAGERVGLVALFDTAPAGYTRVSEQAAASGLSASLAKRLRVHFEVLLRGPDRLGYFRKKVRRVWRRIVYRSWQTVFALFQRFKRPLPQALNDVQQANYLALRNYRPRVYDGEVVLFVAANEPAEFTREKEYGWQVLAAGGVKSVVVPGDHTTMVDEPHVAELARALRELAGPGSED